VRHSAAASLKGLWTWDLLNAQRDIMGAIAVNFYSYKDEKLQSIHPTIPPDTLLWSMVLKFKVPWGLIL
jgi:hypothetical protein